MNIDIPKSLSVIREIERDIFLEDLGKILMSYFIAVASLASGGDFLIRLNWSFECGFCGIMGLAVLQLDPPR